MRLVKIMAITLGILCINAFAEGSQNSSASTQTTSIADKNKAEGDAFLAHNKKNKGVVTLPDGLQYKIIKQGKGPKPTNTDEVVVNYAGTFINGKEFDSSYKQKKPISFPVGGVISGWTEALQLMPVGSTWMLYIPSDLAYRAEGSPPVIPANATLIFKVELLGVKK